MKSKKLTKIYVVRHAQSLFNALYNGKDIHYAGKLGSSLSDKGKQQANDIAKKFKDIKFDAILSSDLKRTYETAQIIAKEKNLNVKKSNAIRERSIYGYLYRRGDLTIESLNRLREEIKNIFTTLNDKAKMQYKHSTDMESAQEGAIRLLNFIKETAVTYAGKTILISCHSNLMRSLLTHLGFATFDELPVGTVENTGYFVLETDGSKFSIKEVYGITKQQDKEGKVRTF
ncbi:MAG: histidine phosphatase family protein [Candidatus Levybacteria bacterium]|nr:histidine phosphatase family protein [Candidatus Levybacteria bacterium]